MAAVQFFSEFVIVNSSSNSEVNKMSSDYRVIFEPLEEGSDEGDYRISEVFYDDDGEISWWDESAVILDSDDFWELSARFDEIAEAFDKPVLVLVNDELVEDDSDDDTEVAEDQE